jgi:hypothetical protein
VISANATTTCFIGSPATGTRVTFLARIALAVASVVVGYGLFAPAGQAPSIMPWDKAEHFTAFFGLMLLAVLSFPRTPIWRIAVVMSFAGAATELIQALPFIHRDGDFWDWVTDTLGILAIVAVLLAAAQRRFLAAAPES